MDSAQDDVRSESWRIRAVSGRGSTPGQGVPPVSEMEMINADGDVIRIGRVPRPDARNVTCTEVHEVSPGWFSHCAICLAPEPRSREHVPPEKFGGKPVTRTCFDCNNKLGSKVERELLDWYDDSIGRASIAGEGVRGHRRVGRIFLRQTSGGDQFFVLEGRQDEGAFRMIMESGEATFTWGFPHAPSYRLAALKSAYLAGCMALQDIPDTTSARQIRRDLVAARDSRTPVPLGSEIAERLFLARSYEGPKGPIVGLTWAQVEGADEYQWVPLISLAGTLTVSWPFDDIAFPISSP